MARPLRIERIGCWYHLTARGNERRDIFRDDKDRRHFLELLEEVVSMFAVRLHAYVLMSNHYHLLVEITEANLSRAIHWLNCEEAIGQGLVESPWDKLIGQAVLGSERFAARLAASLARDDSTRRTLSKRPGLEEVIGVVEEVRGEKWDRFRDRYGDVGRDSVLHLGRTVCGMSIRELSQRAEIRYVSAATALRRFAARAREDREIAKLLRRAMSKLNNE